MKTSKEIIEFVNKNLFQKTHQSLIGKALTLKWFTKNNFLDFYYSIIHLTEFLNENSKLSERIFCILNDITSHPICKICNNKSKWSPYKKRYLEYCSKACSYKDPERILKIKATKLEKYGNEFYYDKEKYGETCLKRYGTKNPMQNKEICLKQSESLKNKTKEEWGIIINKRNITLEERTVEEIEISKQKKIQTMINRYGVTHNMKLEKCLEQRKQTYLKNYGVDNPSKSQIIKDKKVETCLANHGVINGILTPQCKEAFIEKYGVNNANYVPEIHEKQQKYRWKNYTMPSGEIIKIQGYENYALDILLENFKEEEIIIKKSDIPKIWYTSPDGKIHMYYPDIYIPKENLIIEVKSEWTMKKYYDINKLKEYAVIASGYNFRYMIFDNSMNLLT